MGRNPMTPHSPIFIALLPLESIMDPLSSQIDSSSHGFRS